MTASPPVTRSRPLRDYCLRDYCRRESRVDKLYGLVIFDCDGTLVDSEALNNGALIAVLREEGLTRYDMDYAMRHWVGTTASGAIADIEREIGYRLPVDVLPRTLARVHELLPEMMQPIAGAAHLIGTCAAQGPVCVASNGERSVVVESLRHTGLLPFFAAERIFTKAEVARPKPWPDLFLHAAEKMGVAAKDCLVIEDSVPGVTAAVAAGMNVWGFAGSAHNPPAQAAVLHEAGAHNVFARLEQMAEIFPVTE